MRDRAPDRGEKARSDQGRLRIGLVMRDYDPDRGGAERYFVNLGRSLARRGHEVHIFAALFSVAPDAGIHFHRVPMVAKPAWLRLLSFFWNARRLIGRHRTVLDIVQSLTMVYPCHVFRLGGEVQREWLRIRYPNPLARTLKLLFNPVHLLNHYLEKKIMDTRNATQVITISALEKRILRKYYDYPEERITVVYNGVDQEQFHPGVKRFRREVRDRLGIGEKPVVGLFSANNFQRKGLDAVIRALGCMPSGRRPLIVVIGRGKAAPYRRLARRLGVEGSLLFPGITSEPEHYYGASDFLVLPSRYDSFGNVHLEALACGLPVITTGMAGGSEVVRHGETGFVLERTDAIGDLSAAMTDLMDPSLRTRMSSLAPETVRDCSLERNAEETLSVYGRVLEGPRISVP